jgi:hypothetical protein
VAISRLLVMPIGAAVFLGYANTPPPPLRQLAPPAPPVEIPNGTPVKVDPAHSVLIRYQHYPALRPRANESCRPSAAGDERQHCGSYPLPDRPFAATGTELPYARSNTMSHSYFKTPASDDSTRLHIVKAGSRDRARIVEIRTSFSLRASPGKYICATRR